MVMLLETLRIRILNMNKCHWKYQQPFNLLSIEPNSRCVGTSNHTWSPSNTVSDESPRILPPFRFEALDRGRSSKLRKTDLSS